LQASVRLELPTDAGLVATPRATAHAWSTGGPPAYRCGMNARLEPGLGLLAARDMSGANNSGPVLSSEFDGHWSPRTAPESGHAFRDPGQQTVEIVFAVPAGLLSLSADFGDIVAGETSGRTMDGRVCPWPRRGRRRWALLLRRAPMMSRSAARSNRLIRDGLRFHATSHGRLCPYFSGGPVTLRCRPFQSIPGTA
jgi:hypothetical protein